MNEHKPTSALWLAVEGSWEYSESIDKIIGAYLSEKDAGAARAEWLYAQSPAYPDMTRIIRVELNAILGHNVEPPAMSAEAQSPKSASVCPEATGATEAWKVTASEMGDAPFYAKITLLFYNPGNPEEEKNMAADGYFPVTLLPQSAPPVCEGKMPPIVGSNAHLGTQL